MADVDDQTMANANPQGPAHKTKRSRVQFSCTACRYRKLKCDRTHPCDRCTRRGDAASCTYVGHGPRGRMNHAAAITNPTHIQNRIQHLENLILSFAQQKKQEDSTAATIGSNNNNGHSSSHGPGAAAAARDSTSYSYSIGSSTGNNTGNSNSSLASAASISPNIHIHDDIADLSLSSSTTANASLESDPGKLLNHGTTYVDASHWQAILDDLKEVKQYVQVDEGVDHHLDGNDTNQDTFDPDDEFSQDEIVQVEQEASRPMLLFYSGRVLTKQELLADLPSREVVDRLVAKFLNSDDPSLSIIHFPTFQREYNDFWNDPQRVSMPWLAFLYSCMTMAVGIFRRSQETLPAPLGDVMAEAVRFQKNCCSCLINSNYTTVGKYKVEALLLYASVEYGKRGNSAMSVSIILGIAIKLAMRMGYHRDAKHYDSLTALEGEMRRRTWAILSQLDTLTSFQVGIPKQAQNWHSDTELPRNIHDEDFDENSVELPPGLPDTVLTPASYLRSKNRVMQVFGKITDLAYSRQPSTYERVLELDRELEEAHELIAPALRMRPMTQSFVDNVSLIMKRFTLDVLYQKARVVLHRKYLVEARCDTRLNYSRSVCVGAARKILRHQHDLYKESQPGGRLEKYDWFFKSLQHTDFVLAAMIVCLELSKNANLASAASAADQQHQQSGSFQLGRQNERAELIEELKMAREICKDNLKYSVEARKAFYAVNIMLKKSAIDDDEEARRIDNGSAARTRQNGANANTSMEIFRQIVSSPENISAGLDTAVVQDISIDNYLLSNNIANPSHPFLTNGITHDAVKTITTTDSNFQQPAFPLDDTELLPHLQPLIPGLDMIENMLDTPQNFDWNAWDGQMHENDATLWDGMSWDTSNSSLFLTPENIPELEGHANGVNVDGDSDVNGDGGNKNSTSRVMLDPEISLYTASWHHG